MGFSDFHGREKVGLQHGQSFFDQLLHHSLGQVGAGLELVDNNACHGQIGVVVSADFLHVVHQGVQRFA